MMTSKRYRATVFGAIDYGLRAATRDAEAREWLTATQPQRDAAHARVQALLARTDQPDERST